MAGEDPATAALWALHRDRLARQVERFVPAAPAPGMAWRDPRALRFAVLLAAIAAALVAGPERYGRVAAAFDWRDGAAAAATARLDAWIDPPAYANKPPILLDLAANRDPSQKIVTPEGSALVVRADADVFETRVEGAIAPVAGAKPADKSAPCRCGRRGAPTEKRWTIAGDGAVVFRRDGAALGRYEIEATPLGAPTVTLLEPPRANLSGSLTLHYSLADRYGIAGAEAEFANPAAGRRAAAVAGSAAEADAAPAQHGERNRRSDHDGRPFRTSLGGRSGRHDSEGDRRFRQSRRRRADDVHVAAARVPQPARARAGRTAARARPRPRPRAAASRQGDRRADDRARLLPDAGRRLSRPAPGARALGRRAWRRRSPRRRRPVVGDGAQDRGRRRVAGAARLARRRAEAARGAASAARATRSCAS